jgi:hypothetical protein
VERKGRCARSNVEHSTVMGGDESRRWLAYTEYNLTAVELGDGGRCIQCLGPFLMHHGAKH